ncbi:hypothetical protein AYR62_00570 [Secundilactobacillus paracollinoides]|uniref:Gram-positive cocci surface proteins LPxTG domain-containing protein n=2 Tax=Secundilactobacillus paracollinoides TaxID=240427 RepID=A0A1B2IVP3_9LACO|nr:LPXTG cell wall anchor domain-containing protein [Secundilactobacillus paracollinoides]ANZ60277.1 hypothetical protein AYR61_02185 [Secundilactobacillus paracollinoides]ANZ62737.1 hypothetical protein AYR62_00570 [Secundilactobacillus paracollinoides]ANZ66107.1 hypothetical protein AYR63_02385 [Secundilactobacillus paracollinoides]KRL79090.1 hypothetical protein FC17_GL000710 [Secundilactobacillus paracollinoides DSM 15502 = JCM 11969]
MVPALASDTGNQTATSHTQRADDQGAVSTMQNDIAGATTHQQATQNETLPQTDEQASAYSMMGLLGILMSFLGLGVTRKKHDTK